MNFVKKHMFLIVCSLFTIVGFGLLIVGHLKNGANVKDIESLQTIVKNSTKGTVVTNVENTRWQENVSLWSEAEQEARKKSESVSKRPFLKNGDWDSAEKLFPKLIEETSKISYYSKFADSYVNAIDGLIKSVNGIDRYSMQQEKDAVAELSGGNVSNYRTGGGFGGNNSSKEESAADKVIAEMRQNRAASYGLYVSTNAFCCYDHWKNLEVKDDNSLEVLMQDSWYSQIAYWIQQDVIETIETMNTETSILDNPVKRLLEISFVGMSILGDSKPGTAIDGKEAGRIASATVLPGYVMEMKAAAGRGRTSRSDSDKKTKSYSYIKAVPWTSRLSDELVDVVQFDVAVIMESSKMLVFQNELQDFKGSDDLRRCPITILESRIDPVNYKGEKEAGYYYGKAALVELRLSCEYVFVKSGYDELKPQPIKDELAGDKDDNK